MSNVLIDIGMSNDRFIAGSNADPQNSLSEEGHRINSSNKDNRMSRRISWARAEKATRGAAKSSVVMGYNSWFEPMNV